LATWQTPGGGGGWSLTGNAGTSPATNFLGTTDPTDLVIRVNNSEWMRFFSSIGGYVRVYSPGSSSGLLQVGGSSGTAQFNVGGKFGIAGTGTSMREYVDDAVSNTTLLFNNAGGATVLDVTFENNVNVGGILTKGGGAFKIDHPLDPANKYLVHSFVESPDMMNVYNGNITTDANGVAVVTLPGYFETLNKDFRYQLTTIGQKANAYILKEISNNQFVIKTDIPLVKVSWQVTGIRKDPFAEKHRIIPEVEKSKKEKGKYLHPELYGKPHTLGVHYSDTSSDL